MTVAHASLTATWGVAPTKAPTVTTSVKEDANPTSTKPATQPTNAGSRVEVAGLLAGVGALAAFAW